MTNSFEETASDIIIVGGGPVGLLAALRLARRGWRVHIIERWAQPYGLPRAIGLASESMRTLQDLGLADAVSAISAEQTPWYDWRNAKGETILLIDRRAAGPSGWRGLSFSQPDIEALLEREAVNDPLITITRGATVTAEGIDEDDEGVTVHTRDTRTGEPADRVRGCWLIGTDGANSVVRDKIGKHMVDLGFFFDWLVVDVIPTEHREWENRSIQLCSPERPTTIVSSGPGRRRWEFMVLPGERVDEMNSEATAWRLLEPYGVDSGNATLERHAVYTFQARWAQTWNQGRLMLAGDAAHQMPPFAGQGLNSGIRDVVNLTWKLDLILAGKADRSLLDSYTSERSEHVKHAIHYSIELGKVICVLDPDEARARDERMLAAGAQPELVLPPLPPEEFTSGVIQRMDDGAPNPIAGKITPQFFVLGPDGSTARFDDVVGLRAVLLLAPDLDAALPDDLVDAFETIGGAVIEVLAKGTVSAAGAVVDLEGGYTALLDSLGAVAVLQRPDGYYFGCATEPSGVRQLLRDYIEQVRDYAAVGQFVGKGEA